MEVDLTFEAVADELASVLEERFLNVDSRLISHCSYVSDTIEVRLKKSDEIHITKMGLYFKLHSSRVNSQLISFKGEIFAETKLGRVLSKIYDKALKYRAKEEKERVEMILREQLDFIQGLH